MSGRLLTERQEAIVRLVHTQRRATAAQLFSLYRARPITPKALRVVLDGLTELGWLDKVRETAHREANGVAWVVAEAALPQLLRAERLTQRPGAVRPAAPPPPMPAAPVPPPYRPAFVPWVPPRTAPLRAGALDFLRHPSHGACK